MLKLEPNIIIIDDKLEEVNGIIDKYHKEGVGVKYFNAHLTDGDEIPDVYYSDVALVFLDVHFTENINDYDPEHCSSWIQGIMPENAFYILVIWSKETDKRSEIIEELVKIHRVPFLCLEEQKTNYTTPDGYDFSVLFKDIENKINAIKELEELAIWKKSIKESSNQIIGHLSKDLDNVNLLNKKLQKIIVAHGGKGFISDDKHKEKREVLFEALDNILISNSKESRPDIEISKENKINLYNINNNITIDIDSKLNSWFHFKLDKNILTAKLQIGLISKFKSKFLKNTYCLQDDPIVSEYLKPQVTTNKELIDIALLISRPCDIAQTKYGKNLKLISGVLIKHPDRKGNGKKEIKTGQKVDSIKLYDHLYFSESENDISLIFDFRYVFSVPEKIFQDKFEAIKVFNKELLSEMQVEYSSYSSRLGITQVI